MAISLEEYRRRLVEAGLFSAEELRQFEQALPPDRRPGDAGDLATELHRAGRLTRFQAAAVYQGKHRYLVLGEYEILERLGAGGMGQVFKARHRAMDRVVALKILPAERVRSPEAVERFRREVRAAARLIHPNIVIAHDAGEAKGLHFLVTEYVDGQDLARIVAEHGPMPVEEAVGCIIQAAQGLQYAHERGVVHRDIKPGSLSWFHGHVSLVDVGLAKSLAVFGVSGRGLRALATRCTAASKEEGMTNPRIGEHFASGRMPIVIRTVGGGWHGAYTVHLWAFGGNRHHRTGPFSVVSRMRA